MLAKEDFTPTGADRIVFTWAPVVVFLAAVMTFLVIPFGPGLVGRTDLNIGLLYLFAVGGMTVVGLLMAGWSSFNKYSLLGGLRSAAQVVSYEIPLTLVGGRPDPAGRDDEPEHARRAAGGLVLRLVRVPPAAGRLIFFIAATAEANRTPFDLTEADSEIVAGFATEYSGMRFGFLFFAEYVNVFIISALMVTLFFGAGTPPFAFPCTSTSAWTSGRWGIGLLIVIATAPVVLHAAVRARRSCSLAARCPPGRRWCSASSRSTWWPSACCSGSPTSSSTGSPGWSGSWSRRSCSCSCSCGCAARCPGCGSTS